MASFIKDILFYASKIEKKSIENDALAKKIIKNTSMMRKDIEEVKQLINMSERANPVGHNKTQTPGIESLERRDRGNACSQVKNSRKSDQTVVKDNQIVEGLSRRGVKVSLVDNGHDAQATDDVFSYEVEGSVDSVSITKYSQEVDTGDLSGKREKDTLKRKHNESVVDCGLLRRISKKEEEFIVLKNLKKEENPCDDTFVCSFCTRSFGSAGPLAVHLERHYSGLKHQRLDCPWPDCSYANSTQNLTKHMRSKHTKEELFQCTQCLKKFRTMDMKMIHEKKHSQQDVWSHCRTCLRFFKAIRGACSFCK